MTTSAAEKPRGWPVSSSVRRIRLRVVRGGLQLVPGGHLAHPSHCGSAVAAGFAEVGEGAFGHLAALA